MDDREPVISLLNGLLGVYWTSYAQHQTHVALAESWGLSRLAGGMRGHIDDEPETIGALLNRLLDLGGRPEFTLGDTKIGTSLREVLENDLELQRMAPSGLNAAAEAAGEAHDATTRIMLEGVLADEEEHLAWLETELALLDKLGEQLYFANRVGSPEAGPSA
jgi:bacterioferritin